MRGDRYEELAARRDIARKLARARSYLGRIAGELKDPDLSDEDRARKEQVQRTWELHLRLLEDDEARMNRIYGPERAQQQAAE